jgi:hypothetical protein
MILNVYLLPPPEFSASLTAYSQYLSQASASRFVLGTGSVPHATMLQFESRITPTDVVSHFKQLELSDEYKVTLAGLALLPTDSGDLWCEIAILKSAELLRLQQRLVEAFSEAIAKVTNGIGDAFRPHFTVGLFAYQLGQVWQVPDLPPQLLRRASLPCRLALGESGENFQLRQQLAVFEP